MTRRLLRQTGQTKALARTSSRAAAKRFSSRILRPGLGLVLVPATASQSTPGKFYQIESGDTLFGLAKKAYGASSMERARLINNSAYNWSR
jgi:nucleoid-associated protein YgaU